MSKLGFIGLGIMGAPMAEHLIKGGHEVFLHTRSQVPEHLSQAGGVVCQNACEVAQNADFIFLMVPDTPHVEAVLFEENGIAQGLTANKTVIDMSSISPIATKDFGRRIEALGCHYMDAPVSGGEVGAKAATLSIMIGCNEKTFENVKPFLELMGKNINRVGEIGDGQTCKVANQIIVALNLQAVSEALVFASKSGADPSKVREALLGGFASSKILEVHGERMIKRTFDPGFRIELHQKDLNLALDSAKTLGLSMPNTALTQQMFSTCVANGGSGWDHSAIIQATEIMSDHKIG